MSTKDDRGYREDWDMTTEEGSLCFASCIHANLVGGEQKESDLTWLANYLRVNSSACRAYAYLDQPEPEGLTDEEILNLSQEHQVSYTMCDGGVIYPLQAGADMKDDVLSFARAIIAADRARWGRPAVEPETNGTA